VEAVVASGESQQRQVQFPHVLQIDHSNAAVGRRVGVAEGQRLLREEGLAAGHVQTGMRPRDDPIDAGERVALVLFRGVGEGQPSAFDTPEPSVLELPAVLGGRGIRKHRGDR
jgi:hypothetical protein